MISVVKVAFSPRKRGIYISGMPPGGARGVPSVSPFGGYKMLLNSMLSLPIPPTTRKTALRSLLFSLSEKQRPLFLRPAKVKISVSLFLFLNWRLMTKTTKEPISLMQVPTTSLPPLIPIMPSTIFLPRKVRLPLTAWMMKVILNLSMIMSLMS